MADPMDTYRVTVAPTGETFDVAAGERILAAARRAGVWLPFECGWGSCGTCKVTLVEGEVDLLFADCPSVTSRDARRGRIVTCQTTPVSDVVIKPSWTESAPRRVRPTDDYRARLAEIEVLGPELGRFTFELDRPADYREGQCGILDLGDGLRRCYSMSGLAGLPAVEFVAKRYEGGAGSARLFGLPVGSTVPIELPYGDVWLREDDRPIVLIAGGTGISAILSMARKLAESGDPRPVRAFYGAGSVPELVCWKELLAAVEVLPDAELHGAVVHGEPGWSGLTGFVTDLLDDDSSTLAEAEVYLAGPPVMVDAALDRLRELKIRIDRIHFDRFG